MIKSASLFLCAFMLSSFMCKPEESSKVVDLPEKEQSLSITGVPSTRFSFQPGANKTAGNGKVMQEGLPDELSKEAVGIVANAVADWQINNFGAVEHNRRDWTNGTLYIGLMEWAKASANEKYMNWLYLTGAGEYWEPNKRLYLADDIAVCQMYLEMYQLYKDADFAYQFILPTKERLDYVMENPSKGDLFYNHKIPQSKERWSWCDALFMAPPVYTKMAKITGDEKYLSFMDKEYKATYDFLYDTAEHLFYRDHRFFPENKLEANGAKIFWGRGNGWVMGGLVPLLKDLPENSEYRPFYEKLFIEMVGRIKDFQDENGLWHASLLDPGSYPNPETSSSAFFLYALSYGVNSGLLPKEEFLPLIEKAWKGLVACVNGNGKLGWVQPIGEDPKNVCAEMTEVYGVGALLLAASELYMMPND